MAEDVMPAAQASGEPSGEETPATPSESSYSHRFRLLLGALIGIALGAVGATLVVAMERGAQDGPAWSAWRPSAEGDKAAQQIADHVAASYKQPGGGQLVLVKGGPLKVADLPAKIALRQGTSDSISVVDGKTVLYNLCGLGPRCSINQGRPSVERFLLLRREALELALYTFRYQGDVDHVVALFPPPPGKKAENALFLRRDDVDLALDAPLGATLPPPPPPVDTLRDSPEGSLVSRLTNSRLFRFAFQQSQDLSAFLVLAPMPTEASVPSATQRPPAASSSGSAAGSTASGDEGTPASASRQATRAARAAEQAAKNARQAAEAAARAAR